VEHVEVGQLRSLPQEMPASHRRFAAAGLARAAWPKVSR
jgi:hypothetical protein